MISQLLVFLFFFLFTLTDRCVLNEIATRGIGGRAVYLGAASEYGFLHQLGIQIQWSSSLTFCKYMQSFSFRTCPFGWKVRVCDTTGSLNSQHLQQFSELFLHERNLELE
jgi:hypothetical protein